MGLIELLGWELSPKFQENVYGPVPPESVGVKVTAVPSLVVTAFPALTVSRPPPLKTKTG